MSNHYLQIFAPEGKLNKPFANHGFKLLFTVRTCQTLAKQWIPYHIYNISDLEHSKL